VEEDLFIFLLAIYKILLYLLLSIVLVKNFFVIVLWDIVA